MTALPPRVVFDCMIYAQALMSGSGPSAACVEHVRAGELVLIWSDYVLQEVRELPPKLPSRFAVTDETVESFLAALAPLAMHISQIPAVYNNPFDADDSHYIDLAVASQAKLLTSRDRDLLNLMDTTRVEGRDFRQRFPDLQILQPDELLELLRKEP